MAMNEYITNDGYNLLQRMLAGECTIDFTRIEMGDGNSSEPDLRKVKSLTNTVVSLVIDKVIKQEDNTISVSAIFTNEGLGNGFFFKEKGIFASDGNKEILFSYANAGSAGNYIEPPSVELVEKKIMTHITQCQRATEPINIVLKSGLYVDYATYNNHLGDLENPHKVNKEQIGLGNVDNTHDLDKPVSVPVQEALDAYYAQLTAYADKAIADLINGAPTTLDTLKELADAIKKNQDVQTALDAAIGKKQMRQNLIHILKRWRAKR